jgi:acyl dehydratase
VTIELKVLTLREEKGIGVIETIVRNQKGEVVVKGEATIMRGDKV